jgi:hypothetical protein
MRSNFGLFKIFIELFILESDSPVYSPPGSRSERLERSKLFNHVPLANGYKKSPMVNFLRIVSVKAMASP